MIEGILHLFSARPLLQVFVDLVDILVVTYVIYRALLVLRGTRAMQMGTGLGVIVLVYVVSKWAGFVTLFNLLSFLLSSIILIVVVVFQNDIRRGLMRVGARAFFGGMARQQETRVIDEVVAAATELARHRIGALICFEQDANLDEFVVGQGTTLDSSVQRELLVSLFLPESLNKLHDGAVVIRNLRIAKAGVFFPMPDTKVVDKSLGSRHRAALGITEETDAVVVVVSEERGTISFCFNGNIVPNLDGASLKQALLGLFGQRSRAKKKASTPPGKRPSLTPTPVRVTLPGGVGPASSSRISSPPPPAREDVPPSSRLTPPARDVQPKEPRDVDIGPTGPSRSAIVPPEDSVPIGRLTEAGVSRPMQPSAPIETPIPMPRSSPPPREGGQ